MKEDRLYRLYVAAADDVLLNLVHSVVCMDTCRNIVMLAVTETNFTLMFCQVFDLTFMFRQCLAHPILRPHGRFQLGEAELRR